MTTNKLIDLTHCLKEWAEILNINYSLLYNRITRYKWDFYKSITTPSMRNRRANA